MIIRGKERDMEKISIQVERLVREYANNSSEFKKLEGTKLIDDLEYDSISLMELIVAIEETFNISIEEDMFFDSFDTYDGILEYVLRKLG